MFVIEAVSTTENRLRINRLRSVCNMKIYFPPWPVIPLLLSLECTARVTAVTGLILHRLELDLLVGFMLRFGFGLGKFF